MSKSSGCDGSSSLKLTLIFQILGTRPKNERVKRDIATLKEKINELELKLVARDEQPKERKAAANSNEKCEKLELVLTKNEILMEQEFDVHNWKINWKCLEENNGSLESGQFFRAYGLYLVWNIMILKAIYSHRCRCDDDEKGIIENSAGLDYDICVICNNMVVHNNSGSLEDYILAGISTKAVTKVEALFVSVSRHGR